MRAVLSLERYTVLQRLGAGGMAEVFKCRQSGLGGFEKLVVIKRILPHLVSDEAFVSMFLDEARIAASLSHPNIVQVFEIDADPRGVPYLVMEYVRGPSLAQLIKQAWVKERVDLRHLARLVEGAARGLHHAHHASDASGKAMHIVHRDVSPHNVLVTLEGCAKVADFGVARAEGRITHTQSGVVKGKVRYTAPEVLVDPEKSADPRSDVFSLGVCLYVATTNEHPFSGPTDLAVMELINRGVYRAPSELVQGYPPALERIVAGLLAHDPAQRFASALAGADALHAWLASSPGSTDAELGPWVQALSEGLLQDTPVPPAPPAESGKVATRSVVRAPAPPEVLDDVEILIEEGKTSALRTQRASRSWALLVVLLVGAAAGAAVWMGRQQAEVARREDEERTAWLDEAGRQLAAGHFLRAEELLKKGAAVPNRDTADELRLTQLEADLRFERSLAAAHAAMRGGDLEAARTLGATLLSLEGDEPRAHELAKELKALEEARLRAVAMVEKGDSLDAGSSAAAPSASGERGDDSPASASSGARASGERGTDLRATASARAGSPSGERSADLRAPSGPRPEPDAGTSADSRRPPSVVEGATTVDPPPVVVPHPVVALQRVHRPGPSALHVAANSKAQVFVDGLPVGWTPLTVEVSATTHLVMVWAEGSESSTERVVVAPEELVALAFTLRPSR